MTGADTGPPSGPAVGPGAVLAGKWRVERELGRGGFGIVYEVEELRLHARQAVKVLYPEMTARQDLLGRFRREVNTMRDLVHPRIVRVFDYEERPDSGLALFGMELVEGSSVRAVLEAARTRGAPVPAPLALGILVQVFEALAAAHARGVVHRDVTPTNVLLAGGTAPELLEGSGRDPQVKLVDFGIASVLEPSELSRTCRVAGTAAYAAPEVLDPRDRITAAADVYGAGAVLYELLTGELPLGRFDEPSKVRPELPKDLDDLVLSLLQRRSDARPQARQAGEAVRRLLQVVPRAGSGEGGRPGAPACGPVPRPGVDAVPFPAVPMALPGAAPPAADWGSRTVGMGVALGVIGVLGVAGLSAALLSARYGSSRHESSSAAGEAPIPSPTRAAVATRPEVRWVTIPAGTFTMGCTAGDLDCRGSEWPPHRVTLTRGFRMAATETTNGQYRACVEAGECEAPHVRTAYDDPHRSSHPVASVAWEKAETFCRWLGGRLPTESEWEWAARGGVEGNRFPNGWSLTRDEANFGKDEGSGGGTGGRDEWLEAAPVGRFEPNRLGLFDMAGNVAEWCSDWFGFDSYRKAATTDPRGLDDGGGRVVRGGAWNRAPVELRVSHRLGFAGGDDDVGFRCVLEGTGP